MAILFQEDKRSGNTYVYESKSYRDESSYFPKSKRKLIGKIDEKTGKLVPTDGRGKKRSPYYNKESGEEKPLLTVADYRNELENIRTENKNLKQENEELKKNNSELRAKLKIAEKEIEKLKRFNNNR